MRYSVFKTILLLFLFVILAQFVGRYFFGQRIDHLGGAIFKDPASYAFIRMENAGFFLRNFINAKNIILENEDLKKENFSLLSRFADYEDLKNENDFLRKSLNISPRFNKNIAYASIYHFQLGTNGYDVLINKGANDGISDKDFVITEEGVLVGKIKEVDNNFSRVLVVSDPEFSVTAKAVSSGTAGIAKGAMSQGLYLDLIVQGEPIKEGDIIVSSGMDLIPPSLILGTVSLVEESETALFKTVKIRPSMGEIKIGRVLVISR